MAAKILGYRLYEPDEFSHDVVNSDPAAATYAFQSHHLTAIASRVRRTKSHEHSGSIGIMSVISCRAEGVGLALEIDRYELHQRLAAARDANRLAGSGSHNQFTMMRRNLAYHHLLS
jgi:hypothetical protein